jgi:hypothetical protein
MKLTIHGPNLNDQTKGTFHVHTARCRDNKWEVTANGSEYPSTIDADTVEDVVEYIYSDHIAEGSMKLDASAIADFHFAPCVKNLPRRGDEPEADVIAEAAALKAEVAADAKPARKPRKVSAAAKDQAIAKVAGELAKNTALAEEPRVTFKDAAEQVLRAADGPMKVKAIAAAAVPLVRPVPQGKTPDQTLGAHLVVDANKGARFIKTAPGTFDVRELNPRGAAKRPKAKRT